MKVLFNFAVVAVTCLMILWTTQVSAATISFEEIPPANSNCCYLTEEYAHLGIHFITTDDGSIWGGLSNGDPGNWDLEGTNGPAFLGFNGSSYSLETTFDTPITNFSLDVSRSNGSQAGNTFTLELYHDATLLDSITVTLTDINQWTTVSSTVSDVNRTVWFGTGSGFHPFGIDNVQWLTAVTGIEGKVTDASTGQPIAGAVVIALQRPIRLGTQTDDKGMYQIMDLAEGSWRVLAWKKGYRFQIKTVTLAHGEIQTVDFQLLSEVAAPPIPPEFREALNAAPVVSKQDDQSSKDMISGVSTKRVRPDKHTLTTTWGKIKAQQR
ncbi:carboxypeptidase regulatory-like domain-containing protein [Candidatus Poribacteria bacterium]|nr:carboxypeptidase regulatory-like domain-containing protein [Candidatus Poribacteria bacterium]